MESGDEHKSTKNAMFELLLSHPKLFKDLLEKESKGVDASEPSSNELDNTNGFMRNRRRISIFKNVYHNCRIQKRKEKTFCLYLANLYHNVKGFHGL